ncbi:hypothetical protein [Tardiphaga robiniae]|uniref:DUF4105 domain-containing protein n=1 Tax=Tardiphaga robiniae TaxID=943830 RepID=A0A7G6TVG7_9BRAD|nr:hypothetical protein [Tardiphaga robiniae]QND70749.1 hypothetical protein HB776_05500 [Tardiphaga robiniae]
MTTRQFAAGVGKVFLAVGLGFFVLDLLAWRLTALWSPLKVAALLTHLHISIPPPPWAWLQAVYNVIGASPSAAIAALIGFALYVIFGKDRNQIWGAFLISILIFPITVLKFIFTDTLRAIKFVVSALLIFIFSVAALATAWYGLEYYNLANKFSSSKSCALRQQVFGSVPFDFLYRCIDASGTSADEPERFFAFFMANEKYPDAAARRTGHAWFGSLALRKTESTYVITDYHVTGYGFKAIGGTSCQNWIEGPYSKIQPWVPKEIDELLRSWYCNAPLMAPEGPQVHAPAGQPLPVNPTSAEVNAMLGHKPEVLLAVAINKDQFNNLQYLIDKQYKDPRPYQLLYHDCTTFVRELAEAVGLYVRPRILAPFPSENIYALLNDNIVLHEKPPQLDTMR